VEGHHEWHCMPDVVYLICQNTLRDISFSTFSPLLETCAFSPFGLRTGHGTIPERSGSLQLRLQLCCAHELEN
jgi:hypothetical protein